MNEEKKRPRLAFFVAGVKFTNYKEFINDIKVGDAVTLVPEPANVYDPNAIRIDWCNKKIGYVPSSDNVLILSDFENAPIANQARIDEINPTAKTHMMIKVEIP